MPGEVVRKIGRLLGFAAPALLVACLAWPAAARDRAADPAPFARGPDERPETLLVMVELEDPPAAVVYDQARGGVGHPAAKAAATRAAKQHLARIESLQRALVAELESAPVDATVLYRAQRVYNGIAIRVDPGRLRFIAALPGVRAVRPIPPKHPVTSTSVPFVGAVPVWMSGIGITGRGVSIGIADSGIDYLHTHFGGSGRPEDYADNDPTTIDDGYFPNAKVVGGWDFAGDGDGSAGIAPDPDPMDSCGVHGTHVGGVAAGFGVNDDGTTYIGPYDDATPFDDLRIGPGVAPEADLYALKIYDCGSPFAATIPAIEWAADPDGDGDFSDHLDVINLSVGSPYPSALDPAAVACDNAALVGVIPVGAAGNDGDAHYVTLSPALATRAISVAASIDQAYASRQMLRIDFPPSIEGEVVARYQLFGDLPGGDGLTADVALPDPRDACTQLVNGASVAGRIVLADWSGCPFDTKAAVAEAAGAAAIIISPADWNEIPVHHPGAATPAEIPVVMIRASDGRRIADRLPGVSVTLTRDTWRFGESDVLAEFSSRGPRNPDSMLKPDLTAPGAKIGSAYAGTGNLGRSANGTSHSAPHGAGAMALLRQLHPDWTVEELKALVMNTAGRDLSPGIQGALPHHGLTRVGAGRLELEAAAASDVIVYATEPSGFVSASFGVVEVAGEADVSRTVRVANKGGAAITFDVAFDTRAEAAGVEVSLSESGALEVPAGESVPLEVTVAADVDEILVSCADGTPPLTPVCSPWGREPEPGPMPRARHCVVEEAGYLTLTPRPPRADHPSLRLPVHVVVRPVASMTAAERRVLVTGDEAAFDLHLLGRGLDSGSSPPGVRSRASAFELAEASPDDALTPEDLDFLDLAFIGVTSDYRARVAAGQGLDDTVIQFGIVTHGPWTSSRWAQFRVWIDRDRDGEFDYRVTPQALLGWDHRSSDVMQISVQELDTLDTSWPMPVNGLGPDVADTALYNTDVTVIPVRASELGLVPGDSGFEYRIDTILPFVGLVGDTSALLSFDPARPGLHLTGEHHAPMYWDDLDGVTIPVEYDHDAYMRNGSQGLLLIHHHNANGARVEVVEIVSAVEQAPRHGGDRVIP